MLDTRAFRLYLISRAYSGAIVASSRSITEYRRHRIDTGTLRIQADHRRQFLDFAKPDNQNVEKFFGNGCEPPSG